MAETEFMRCKQQTAGAGDLWCLTQFVGGQSSGVCQLQHGEMLQVRFPREEKSHQCRDNKTPPALILLIVQLKRLLRLKKATER